MANTPPRRAPSDPRPASRRRTRGAAGLRAAVLLLAAGLLSLPACDSGLSGPSTTPALVVVEGRVLDPSGTGVVDASVTITLHETADCSSATLREITGPTGFQGGFESMAGIPEVDPETFQPREICLDFLAEPPNGRPELGPVEQGGLTGTLRARSGEQPLDTVRVELTLPESGGG